MDVHIQILVLPIFETNQGVNILKTSQEELGFATKSVHHKSVILISFVIQTFNIKAIGNNAKSTPKMEFSSCRITLRGNISCKKSSFSYSELNVELAIQFSYHRIKLRWITLKSPTTESNVIHSSFRFVKSRFVQWICICICLWTEIFTMGQATFVPATWNFLVFVIFFFLIFAFLVNFQWIASLLGRCLLKYKLHP